MAKPETHTQVRLRKVNNQMSGYQDVRYTWYTCYIPTEKAIMDKYLQIKQEDGTWEDGWQVHDIFTTLPTATVREREQDYKQTRKASDI